MMIYFDNAATTINKPDSVIQAVTDAMKKAGNSGRGVNEASIYSANIIYNTRKKVAAFFNISNPTRIAWTHNATYALNTVIKGLFNINDHVISTVLEHNSVLRPLYEIEKNGVNIDIVSCDENGDISLDDIQNCINNNTKALITTICSNVTGNITNYKEIAKICKKNNILYIVDASQGAGFMDIDVSDGIDILVFTGHKGLLGPQGIGGMYIADGIEIRPLVSGGSGILTYSKTHPNQMPTHLEAGTLNCHGIAGLGAGIDFINEVGLTNIRNKEISLTKYFYDNIKDIKDIKIYGNTKDLDNHAAIITFNIADYDSAVISDYLSNEYNICVRSGGHCAPLMHEALNTKEQGAVRFSFSYFNTKEEIDIAIQALKNI